MRPVARETAREKLRRRLRARLRPPRRRRVARDVDAADEIVDSSSRDTHADASDADAVLDGDAADAARRASRLDLVLDACAFDDETERVVRRGLARAAEDSEAAAAALTRLTEDARANAFRASAASIERGLAHGARRDSNASTTRSRRRGGSAASRRSTLRGRRDDADADAEADADANANAERTAVALELDRDGTSDGDDDADARARRDAAVRRAAARHLRRAVASGREYARADADKTDETDDDDGGSDIVRPVFASNSSEDVKRWLREGFDALGRFISFRRGDASASLRRDAAEITLDGFDVDALDAEDAARLARWDAETNAKASACVVSWLADRREFDDALAELESLRAHDVGAASSVRLIQRRELLVRAIDSWREFRDVVVALQLGAEEFRYAERTIRLARRAASADRRRREDAEAAEDAEDDDEDDDDDDDEEDSNVSNARWRREFHECALAYATRVPTASETRDAAQTCVMRVRAVNACEFPARDARGNATTTTTTTTTTTRRRRRIDASYADRDVDVNALLEDAARDLRDARDAVVRETRARAECPFEFRAAEDDTDDASDARVRRAIRPLIDRYESTPLHAIVHRAMSAARVEREIDDEGAALAKSALFARCVARPTRAYVARVDDEALEAALRAFENDDTVASSSSSTTTTTRKGKKKGKRRPARAVETRGDVAEPAIDRATSTESSTVNATTTTMDTSDETIARRDDRESLDDDADDETAADASLAGWTPARARRRPAAPPTPRPPPPPRPSPPPPLPRVAPTPSLGLSSRPDFPPKPKPLASAARLDAAAAAESPVAPTLRSVGEYRRMLNTESARERESRLREFPALETTSSSASARRGMSRIPPPRAFATRPATPTNANSTNSTTATTATPTRKTWAEAKRAIDGVKLPSLIKIK